MRNFPAPTSVNVARVTYLVVCELAGIGAALSTKATNFAIPVWVGVVAGLVVAGLVLMLESLILNFTLRGFATTTFGILVGLFCAWLLTKLGFHSVVAGIVEGLSAGDPEIDSEGITNTINLALNIFLFASLAFLGAVLAMRSGRDDFAFIIPYVRFRQDAASGQPLLLDADVIMDGRVPRIQASGFLTGRLIVPRSVLDELKVLASSPSPGKRQRGQRGLDCIEEMQADKSIRISLHDQPDGESAAGMDTRLIQTARMLGARLLTTDENLTKVARLQNAEVLNISDLSDALKPAVVVGEKIHLALVRAGKDDHQAVGYLPDGTLIVVNHGAPKIGTTQDVLVISTLQTTAGQMVFAELYDPDETGR